MGDLDVNCEATAGQRFGLAIPVLLILSLGVPALLGSVVCYRRGQSPTTKYQMSYLVANYARHAQYWEAVAMVRKGSLAVLTALLEPVGVAMQVSVTLLIVVLNLLAVTALAPLRT